MSTLRPDGVVPEPTDREFHQLRELILRLAGIYLGDSKKSLLYGRLARRIRELQLASFAEYYQRVIADESECDQLLDRMTTNDTQFFREPHHFGHLAECFLPAVIAAAAAGSRPKNVRVWSAGCSTGEEPYSIAMTLLDRLPTGWSIDVLGTDLSTRAVEAARSATWPVARASGIPEPLMRRFMVRSAGSRDGSVRASPLLKAAVRIGRLNLNDEIYPAEEPFDLIFCRNVLIYFEAAHRQRVLRRLIGRLAHDGRLFVGHAEIVQGLGEQILCVSPTIYARAAGRDSIHRLRRGAPTLPSLHPPGAASSQRGGTSREREKGREWSKR